MKAYIGNKVLLLAQSEEREGVQGYGVIYPDGSETFLVKEIFEFEFRALEDEEVDLVIDSVNMELTSDDIKELVSMTEEDWEETFDLDSDTIVGDPKLLDEYEANPENFEVTEFVAAADEIYDKFSEAVKEDIDATELAEQDFRDKEEIE